MFLLFFFRQLCNAGQFSESAIRIAQVLEGHAHFIQQSRTKAHQRRIGSVLRVATAFELRRFAAH